MQHDLRFTWCNPLPIPDYPRGRCSPGKGEQAWGYMHPEQEDFRELADPSVIWHDGRWYLYPSGRMVYVSDDFITWRHHPLQPEDIGYAPTVVAWRDRFLLTACGAGLWQAGSPLGPFTEIAPMELPDGTPIEPWADPMLFADDDDRLFAYWGLGGPGIFGAELDPERPCRCLTPPQRLFGFDPAHQWERLGEFNEDPTRSFVEGSWMVKVGGRYFLTYAAPGTEWKTYAMGTYVADHPLGPFTYQQRNPILRDTTGLVHGPGHGCIVRGPGETLWAFYTCLARNHHNFERRLGMDPAGIDEHGQLFVRGASETPQWQPGLKPDPQFGNDADLLPLSCNRHVKVSSAAPGRPGAYAVDHVMRTWWQAGDGDETPWLEIDLQVDFTVTALRLLWAEPGLDYRGGALPGPFRFLLEGRPRESGEDAWQVLLDATDNTIDLLCDYRVFPETTAGRVRLTITGHPHGIAPALIDCTLFGYHPDCPPHAP